MHPIFLHLFFYLKPWDILCQICRLPHNSVHLSNTVAACCVDTKGKPNRLPRLFWCTLSSSLENKNSGLRQVWADFWHEGGYFYQLVAQSTVKRASLMLCLSILYGKHVREAASMQLKTWNTVLSRYFHIVGRGVLRGTHTQPPNEFNFVSGETKSPLIRSDVHQQLSSVHTDSHTNVIWICCNALLGVKQ